MDNGYLEHLQHEQGRAANELAAAYEVARMTTPRHDDWAKIAAALAAGKIALVNEYPVYCRFTDALLWTNRELVQVFDTDKEAAGAETFGGDDWGQWLIFPSPRETSPPMAVMDDADIPF